MAKPLSRLALYNASSLRRLPLRLRVDRQLDHAAAVALDRLQHRPHQLVAEVAGPQPQVEQLRVDRVVVVLLGLHPRVLEVLDLDLEAELGGRAADQLGELPDRELLRELVEDPVLAGVGRVVDRQLDTLEGVPNVEEAAGLAAPAVDGERMAHDGLNAESVQDRAEPLVVVEACAEAL